MTMDLLLQCAAAEAPIEAAAAPRRGGEEKREAGVLLAAADAAIEAPAQTKADAWVKVRV